MRVATFSGLWAIRNVRLWIPSEQSNWEIDRSVGETNKSSGVAAPLVRDSTMGPSRVDSGPAFCTDNNGDDTAVCGVNALNFTFKPVGWLRRPLADQIC